MAPESVEQAVQALSDGLASLTRTLGGKWVLFFALVLLTWALARAVSWVVLRRFAEIRHMERAAALLINRLFVFSAVFVGIIAYATALFGINIAAAAATLGLLSLAVGFGLQNTVANIAGGIALAMDRPFRLGDQVEIGEFLGEVEEIGIRSTRIVTLRKEYIVIPNKYLEEQPIINYTMVYPELRLDVKVPISYDSDRRLAERIMLEVAAAHAIILRRPAPRVLLRAFGASAVELELRCWLSLPRSRFIVESDLLKAIKDRFDEEGVEIPLPYQVNLEKKELPKLSRLPPAQARETKRAAPQPRVMLVLTASPLPHQLEATAKLIKRLDALTIGLFVNPRKGRDVADEASQALMDVETVLEREELWFKPIFRLGEPRRQALRDVAGEEDVDLVLTMGHRARFGLDWPGRGGAPGLAERWADVVDLPIHDAPDDDAQGELMLAAVKAEIGAMQKRQEAARRDRIELSPPEPSTRVAREKAPPDGTAAEGKAAEATGDDAVT